MTAPRPVLLPIGTRIMARLAGQAAYGVVEPYEHYSPHQTTFPVRLERHCLCPLMTSADVTVLPDAEQPPDRKPPRRTGVLV